MTFRAITSVFAPDPAKCLAGCDKPDYQNLIVTKCGHIFCKACLEICLENKKECPIDRKPLSDMKTEEGQKEYTSFKLYLERFAHYMSHDFSALKEELSTQKLVSIASCQLLKEAEAKKKSLGKEESEGTTDHCSICHDMPFQMYFIIQDKDSIRIGRHMHEDCWQTTVNNESELLDISVGDMVKVAKKLPWPPKKTVSEPVKPASPLKVFFLLIILPISIWALAMNSRIYRNKSSFLFVLSIPALVIFKILSLLLNGVKAIFADKPA